ncbi:MAG: hypothetical protein OEM47_01045 [Deltaproteobacteria bacterium]|nr:hypothetical protein [Deltaproteobacteria bacterium]
MRRAWAVAFGLLAVLFLSTCGGGGGGGSSLQYTGLTTPAAIDNTNAEEIALAAWFGGEMSDISFLPTLGTGGAAIGGSYPLRVIPLIQTLRKLTDSIGGQNPATSSEQAAPKTVYRDNWREDGVLGYVDISASWDDQTGRLSGSFSFHGYDDGSGVVLSGGIGFSGTTSIYYNPGPNPGDILDLTISFPSFTSTDGINTVKMAGSMAFQFNVPAGGPIVATLNLVTLDEGTGKTVRIDDYTVIITEDLLGSYSDVTISGRIYLHDYGYVDIVTLTPFRVYGTDLYPSSGILTVTGSGGRKARLTALDNTTYGVEVDADANGTYEWSITGPWT